MSRQTWVILSPGQSNNKVYALQLNDMSLILIYRSPSTILPPPPAYDLFVEETGLFVLLEQRFSNGDDPLPPHRDIWQLLETFFVVTNGEHYWYLVGRGQGCCEIPYNTQDRPS